MKLARCIEIARLFKDGLSREELAARFSTTVECVEEAIRVAFSHPQEMLRVRRRAARAAGRS